MRIKQHTWTIIIMVPATQVLRAAGMANYSKEGKSNMVEMICSVHLAPVDALSVQFSRAALHEYTSSILADLYSTAGGVTKVYRSPDNQGTFPIGILPQL